MSESILAEHHGTKLIIQGLRKTYTDTVALDDVSVDVQPGEFFTLLGPSGCGKTTLLRSVAGFVKPDRGKVYFDEQRIDTLPPQKRNIGMVFQDYAVFPHLSVQKNVGYGLAPRGVPAAEAAERIKDALRLVDMSNLAHRMPAQLSGGQQQRVAVARAVVIRPAVLLMDEPLSNLDAKLRIQMRRDIRALQSTLKITTVYVTHDQAEALAVSDRIAVMRGGNIEQVAAPEELYRKPRTPFVARFLGNENIVTAAPSQTSSGNTKVEYEGVTYLVPSNGITGNDNVAFMLRPESLQFVATSAASRASDAPSSLQNPTDCFLRGTVLRREYGGSMIRTQVQVSQNVSLEVLSVDGEEGSRPPTEGENVTLRYRVSEATVFAAGDSTP